MQPGQIIAGGVIGAAAAEAYHEGKEKAAEFVRGGGLPEHGPIEMHMMVDLLSRIEKMILEAKNNIAEPVFVVKQLTLNSAPESTWYQIKRGLWKHVSVMVNAAITVAVITDIGEVDFSLSVGWNAFDMPPGSLVAIKTGSSNPLNVIFYYGEDALDIPGV